MKFKSTIHPSAADHLHEKAQALLSRPAEAVASSMRQLAWAALGSSQSTRVGGETRHIYRYAQVFANNPGFDVEILERIRDYAQAQHDHQGPRLLEMGFTHDFHLDMEAGCVANLYTAPVDDLLFASPEALKCVTQAIAILAERMMAYGKDPEREAGYEDYHYRNLPSDIEPDDVIWLISGLDRRTGTQGVLEWCRDKDDAQAVLASMARFPRRFAELKAGGLR